MFRNAADPIDTVLFTDGLKRVLQTKKDISLFSGPASAPQDVMSVSGRSVYDAFGRAIAQSYPVTEALGNPGVFNDAFDAIAPTRTEYDVLDRTTRTVLPDNTVTTISYGFGGDRVGQVRDNADSIAAHCDSYYSLLSETGRTACSMISGKYLDDFFFMAPFSQMLEPPRFPGRFNKIVYASVAAFRDYLTAMPLLLQSQ